MRKIKKEGGGRLRVRRGEGEKEGEKRKMNHKEIKKGDVRGMRRRRSEGMCGR